MGEHDHHRARLMDRFLKYGLDNFQDHEVLELLLFFAIPRIDTNPLGHRLMKEFSCLYSVLEAPVEELTKVDGIGSKSACLIHLVMELVRRYGIDRQQHEALNQCMNSPEQFGSFLQPYFTGLRREVVMLACFDHKGKALSCDKISEGTLGEAYISPRAVVENALRHNAHGVVLAHNHPGGVALPSAADVEITTQIQKALQTVDIHLFDHLVFGSVTELGTGELQDYISLRQNRML